MIAQKTHYKLEREEEEKNTLSAGCWASHPNAALCSLISTLRGHSMAFAATPFSPIDFAIFLTPASLARSPPPVERKRKMEREGVMPSERREILDGVYSILFVIFIAHSLTLFLFVSPSITRWIKCTSFRGISFRLLLLKGMN